MLVAGCDGYIAKPIDVDAFPVAVAEFLRGRREQADAGREGMYLRDLNQRFVDRLMGSSTRSSASPIMCSSAPGASKRSTKRSTT